VHEPPLLAALRMAGIGIAGGGVFLMTQAMLPDAIEADRHMTGERRAGMFTGVYIVVEKLASAIGAAALGGLLSALGYLHATEGHRVVQPERALIAIRLCVSLLPALFIVFALLAIRGYSINAASLERLRRGL
jgi:Na+/melibiose symporter-like transporter